MSEKTKNYYLLFIDTTMGFTTQESNSKTIASIMLKKEWLVTEPSFWKRTKNDQTGKREPTEFLWTVVKWKFKWISSKVIWEWDNAMELVEIELEDENGSYVVSTAWTQISRNIINSLAWTAREFKIENLEIWLYEKAGKDWKMYPRVWIKNNWQQTTRALSIEEQDKFKKEVTFKGKKMFDWTDLENILRWYFDAINWEALNDPEFSEPEEVKPKKKISDEEQKILDDLPF